MAKMPQRKDKAQSKKKPVRRRKRVRTMPYDVAEELRNPAEMAAYLDAVVELAPDDSRSIATALGDVARAYGMSKIAKEAGLSRESLYKALGEQGNPSLDTVVRVARAVGMRFRLEEA